MGILGPSDGLVLCHQPTREFVVAVLALVADPLLQPRSETCASTTLRLPKSVCVLAQFVGVGSLLASREGQERVEARVNTYRSIASVGNDVGLCVDEETEIPARCPLDDATAFETSCRDGLRMKADMAYPWNVETCAICGFEGIRERDAR